MRYASSRHWRSKRYQPPTLDDIERELARRQSLSTVAKHQDLLAEDRERCTKSLLAFVRAAWHVLEPEATFKHGRVLEAIAEHLEAVNSGQITRLRMNVPPGCMKSLMTSVFYPAWEWGPKALPGLRFINTSYAERFGKRDSRKMRDLIQSDWYQMRWGEGSTWHRPVILTREAEMSFENTERGTRDAIPFGSLTGGRGDRLMIDDPHSTEQAESDAERENAQRIFLEQVPDRINDPLKSAIVLMMQRLHVNDISGIIEKLALPYVSLVLPMEFEVERRCHTVIGFKDWRLLEGELLWPERFPRSVIDGKKGVDGKAGEMTAYAIACQYQQRPVPREGGMFKRAWFTKVVKKAPAIGKRVRCWDLAGTVVEAGKDPSWTAGVKILRDADGMIYIEDVVRLRELGFTVRKTVLATAQSDARLHNNSVRIRVPKDPAQAGKEQASSYTRMLGAFPVGADPQSGEKETRAQPFADQCEAGNVTLVEGSWNEAYIDELCNFPGGGHDDQVDASSGAYNFIMRKWLQDMMPKGAPVVGLYRG